nr:MAG TPA: helix-turn-helix domain protein [Caudoviricetes sp.]
MGGDIVRQWLVEKRKSQALSQAKIAERVGVTRQMISAVENGTNPSTKTAQRIAQVLGFDWTLFYSDPDQPQQRGA